MRSLYISKIHESRSFLCHYGLEFDSSVFIRVHPALFRGNVRVVGLQFIHFWLKTIPFLLLSARSILYTYVEVVILIFRRTNLARSDIAGIRICRIYSVDEIRHTNTLHRAAVNVSVQWNTLNRDTLGLRVLSQITELTKKNIVRQTEKGGNWQKTSLFHQQLHRKSGREDICVTL